MLRLECERVLRLGLVLGLGLGLGGSIAGRRSTGGCLARVPTCAQGPDHHVDTFGGEHDEHQADTGRDPVVFTEGEIHDAHAENRPHRDEQGLADPERQATDEKTEHPAITPEQDHIRRDGSHNSGRAQGSVTARDTTRDTGPTGLGTIRVV